MTGHFTVYVGAQPYLDGPIETGPTLVIDADADKLLEVSARHASAASHQPLSVFQAVLASTDHEVLVWYRFNDSRLNGSLDAESWNHIYPNVTIVDHHERQARALDSLLDEYQASLGELPHYGKLVLSQGDYLQALNGLSSWESRITAVSVCGPSAQQIWTSRLNPWLSGRGFVSEDGGTYWQKDPLSFALRENQQLKTQIKRAQEMIDLLLSDLSAK
jgi:hypothetical protein